MNARARTRLGCLFAIGLGLAPAGAIADREDDAPSEAFRTAEERTLDDELLEEELEGVDVDEDAALRDAREAATADARRRAILLLIRDRERMIGERRAEAIALLEAFIRDEPRDALEMPDALLRLAELRWEDARQVYLVAFRAWRDAPEESRGPEPTIDYTVPMRLYERLLSDYPDFHRRDFVLYMKAYALLDSNREDEALAVYRQILREHPESRFVPDAHFAWAEHYLAAESLRPALREYDAVLALPRSEIFDVALFKSAFCLWRLGNDREAALRFRRVLDLDGGRGDLSEAQMERLRELQEDALDYLIELFTSDESNTARDVFRFLEEIGGERYALRVVRRLAQAYDDQGRHERAEEAYGLLIELDPTAPDAPDHQRAIARAHFARGDDAGGVEALRVLAETYGRDSTWASQQPDRDIVRAARERTEITLRRRALRFHARGQEESDRGALETAEGLYGLYYTHFRSSEHAYALRFNQAEILFHRLERYPEAGVAYLDAARLDPEGELTRDALYNAVAAFERVRVAELDECEPGSCEETENDRLLTEAFELYLELYPDDPDLPEILFRQGRLYYDRGIYDTALRLFGQLLERFPSSPFAVNAGELVLESFQRADDYENIEAWARRLKALPAFADDAQQERLDGIIVHAIFSLGEQRAEAGEHRAAARAYYRAADEFPTDDRARQALYNAGLEAQRGGDLALATRAYDRLVERYPGTSEGALGAWTAARMFASIAQFEDAARYYEAYAERFPDDERTVDARYDAALLWLTAGNWDNAVAAGQRFIENHRRHESLDEVLFIVARAHEGAGRTDEAVATYRDAARRLRDRDKKAEALVRLAEVLLRAEREDEAAEALAEAVRFGRRNRRRLDEGLFYIAKARFLEAERVIERYEAIRLAGSMEGLGERLQNKAALLAEAAEIYADVASFEVAEWLTASLYRIGSTYEEFARALNEFELPEGLSEDEEMVYLDELARFIVPMEERALDAYAGGYARAVELRIFNEWTARLREGLTRLNEIEFPPLREMGADIEEPSPLARPEPVLGVRRGDDAAGDDSEAEDE